MDTRTLSHLIPPWKGNSQEGSGVQALKEIEMRELRMEIETMRTIDNGDSRRPRWRHLVNYLRLIYSYMLTLKCSLNLTISKNPSTAILGMSNPTTTILGWLMSVIICVMFFAYYTVLTWWTIIGTIFITLLCHTFLIMHRLWLIHLLLMTWY
jgi:hypothetical protein